MANRSYLYALSHQPTHYRDRPESIVGLSEWAYGVPLLYYVLLSGEPRLCPSLIFEGFEDDDPDKRTPLHALTGDFASGIARLERLARVLRRIAPRESARLREALSKASSFLAEHRDRYFLLETLELDAMQSEEAAALRQAADDHLAAAQAAGRAVDALSRFDFLAAPRLRRAVGSGEGKLAPFKGLSLADDFDHADTERVLGAGFWSTVLYFAPANRQAFEERNGTPES